MPLAADRATEPAAVRGHIPWRTVNLRLRAGRSIWLATTRPDGRPHAMPVWYWWDTSDVGQPRLYFITARSTQKAANLAHEPWVEAHLGDGDDVTLLRGRAVIVTDRADQERIDGAWRRNYVDPVSGATASVFDNPADDLYRLDVVRLIAWSYGTVGGWTEWRFGTDAGVDSPAP